MHQEMNTVCIRADSEPVGTSHVLLGEHSGEDQSGEERGDLGTEGMDLSIRHTYLVLSLFLSPNMLPSSPWSYTSKTVYAVSV